MALADYRRCDACQKKTFYDAELHYQDEKDRWDLPVGVGAWAVICEACAETYRVDVVRRVSARGAR